MTLPSAVMGPAAIYPTMSAPPLKATVPGPDLDGDARVRACAAEQGHVVGGVADAELSGDQDPRGVRGPVGGDHVQAVGRGEAVGDDREIT